MTEPRPDYDVLVLAPVGRDAQAATDALRREGIQAFPFRDLTSFCERMSEPVGAILIAEEALNLENAELLKGVLSRQEPWSSLPIIIMTSQVERIFRTEQIVDAFGT